MRHDQLDCISGLGRRPCPGRLATVLAVSESAPDNARGTTEIVFHKKPILSTVLRDRSGVRVNLLRYDIAVLVENHGLGDVLPRRRNLMILL
jgi:hypothetical protein